MSDARKRLLVIDDSPVETMIFRALTKNFECDVFITESFDDAVEHCSQNKIDVLITDLNIGEKSGFDVIDSANSNPDNTSMKSFICSAASPADHKDQMKESKVYGWIIKPVETNSIKNVLGRLLS